jgi:hypothetical protein
MSRPKLHAQVSAQVKKPQSAPHMQEPTLVHRERKVVEAVIVVFTESVPVKVMLLRVKLAGGVGDVLVLFDRYRLRSRSGLRRHPTTIRRATGLAYTAAGGVLRRAPGSRRLQRRGGQRQPQNHAPRPAQSRADETLEMWDEMGRDRNKHIAMGQDFPEDKYALKAAEGPPQLCRKSSTRHRSRL